jgi:hypothetical protein
MSCDVHTPTTAAIRSSIVGVIAVVASEGSLEASGSSLDQEIFCDGWKSRSRRQRSFCTTLTWSRSERCAGAVPGWRARQATGAEHESANSFSVGQVEPGRYREIPTSFVMVEKGSVNW